MERVHKKHNIFLFMLIPFSMVLSSCQLYKNINEKYVMTDMDLYLNKCGQHPSVDNIFPKKEDIQQVNRYSYIDYEPIISFEKDSPSYVEIILDVTYDQIGFNKELDRFKNYDNLSFLGIHHIPRKYKVDLNKELFNYETYVAKYNPCENRYTYACVDYDNLKIIYIYIWSITLKDVSFDHSLLPKNLEANLKEETRDPYFYVMYEYRYDSWLDEEK